jgi:hypothetical protein
MHACASGALSKSLGGRPDCCGGADDCDEIAASEVMPEFAGNRPDSALLDLGCTALRSVRQVEGWFSITGMVR